MNTRVKTDARLLTFAAHWKGKGIGQKAPRLAPIRCQLRAVRPVRLPQSLVKSFKERINSLIHEIKETVVVCGSHGSGLVPRMFFRSGGGKNVISDTVWPDSCKIYFCNFGASGQRSEPKHNSDSCYGDDFRCNLVSA